MKENADLPDPQVTCARLPRRTGFALAKAATSANTDSVEYSMIIDESGSDERLVVDVR